MKIDKIDSKGKPFASKFIPGSVDDVSEAVLNEEASNYIGQSVEIGDGCNDFLYFFNDAAECLARVNIY